MAGARLNRWWSYSQINIDHFYSFNKQIKELDPRLEKVVSVRVGEKEFQDIGPRISALKDNATAISIRADRALEQLSQLNTDIDLMLNEKLEELQSNTKDLIETSNWIIERIKSMQNHFENSSPYQINREQAISEAEQKLTNIRQQR